MPEMTTQQLSTYAPTEDHSRNFCLHSDFLYTHKNPYHQKLEQYSDFVLRDREGESFAGLWNEKVFHRSAPLQIEIGTGYGNFMLEYCQKNPHINFVGLDYRFKRSFQLAQKLDQLSCKNFKLLRAKGERIHFLFSEHEVQRVFYFFPDPWPKQRHHKKRLFQKSFLDSLYFILSSQGEVWIKTDHLPLYDWMMDLIQQDVRFACLFHTTDLRGEYPEHYLSSFQTTFEKLFIQKGVRIKAIVLRSLKSSSK